MNLPLLTSNDAGLPARAKINAAIDLASKTAASLTLKADGVLLQAIQAALSGKADVTTVAAVQQILAGKANAADLTALAQTVAGKAATDLVQTLQASVSAAALRSAGAEIAYTGGTDRPGEGGFAFAQVSAVSQLGGSTATLPRLAAGVLAFGAAGSVARVVGSSLIGSRVAYAVEPGRVYRARFVVQRRTNTSDPSNDTVRVAIAWLDQAKNVLPGARAFTVVKDLLTLLASGGRQEIATTFALSAGAAVLITAPPNAVYARPFVQTFGADCLTDIEVIDVSDLTDALTLDPISTDAMARLSAVESQNLGPRVASLESEVQNPNSLTFGTRSDAAAATIPSNVTTVLTRGALAPGDGGGRVHSRVASLAPGARGFTSQDGGVWQSVARWLDYRDISVIPADAGAISTDASAALTSPGFAAVPSGGTLNLSGTLTISPYQALVFNPGSNVTGSGTVTNTGTVIRYGGAASALPYHPEHYFGPAGFQVEAAGAWHGILASINQTGTSGASFPCAVVGLAQLNDDGNTAFAGFFRADQYSTGTCTSEFNTFNHHDFPPSLINGMPSRSFGIDFANPVTVSVAAGGKFPSTSAIHITSEGEEPSYYRNGLYMYPQAVTDIGFWIDATNLQGPTTSMLVRNRGQAGEQHLFLQTSGIPNANGKVITHADYAGNGTFTLWQDGRADFGASISSTKITLKENYATVEFNSPNAPADAKKWQQYADPSGTFHFRTQNDDETDGADFLTFGRDGVTPVQASVNAGFVPQQDAEFNLGSPAQRWANVFAANGTISTSDGSQKTPLEPFSDAHLDAWGEVRGGLFQFLDAISAKGSDGARIHAGYIAQDVRDALTRHGIDPARCGLFCADQKVERHTRTRTVERPVLETVSVTEQEHAFEGGVVVRRPVTRQVSQPKMRSVPVVDAAGAPVVTTEAVLGDDGQPVFNLVQQQDAQGNPAFRIRIKRNDDGSEEEIRTPLMDRVLVTRDVPATMEIPVTESVEETYNEDVMVEGETQFGLRYDQCAVWEAAYQRRRADRIEARLAALEAKAA